MNQWIRRLTATFSALLLVGAFGFAQAAEPTQQQDKQQNQVQQPNQEQQPNNVNPGQQQPNAQEEQQPQSNVQEQQKPQANARQKNMRTFTGKVTEGGGFIAQNGEKYRLNGAKAAGLRHYANKTVTIKGRETKFEGHNAIDVASFQAGQSQTAQNLQQNMQQLHNQSNFRSQPQGEQAPQPGHTGYEPNQNRQPAQNR